LEKFLYFLSLSSYPVLEIEQRKGKRERRGGKKEKKRGVRGREKTQGKDIENPPHSTYPAHKTAIPSSLTFPS